MFGNLEVMRMSHALAVHAGGRQDAVARNIANADTPGYRARDVVSFQDFYSAGAATTSMRATRDGHVGGLTATSRMRLSELPGQASPNGNTVSLEAEMMRAAEVRHQHDMATSIYKSSLDLLRTSLGRGR